ncbi:MAG: hypothetical protein AAF975_06580, partial [Spirochaetota bacterium]
HQVLNELDVDEKAQLLVLNKIDLLSPSRQQEIQTLFPQALLISAREKLGLECLYFRLGELLGAPQHVYAIEVPHEAGDLRAWLFRHKLISEELGFTPEGQLFHLSLSAGSLQRLHSKFPRFARYLQTV